MKNISQADKITKFNVLFGEELRRLLTALLEKKGFKNIRLLRNKEALKQREIYESG